MDLEHRPDNQGMHDMGATLRIDESIGLRLRSRRTEINLTCVALARRLGVTEKQLIAWETGEQRINAHALSDLSHALGVTLEEIVGANPKTINVNVGRDQARDGNAREACEAVPPSDSLRLLRGFLRIADARAREKIIALTEKLANRHGLEPKAARQELG